MGADLPKGAAGHRMSHHQAQRNSRLARKACLRCAMAMQEDVLGQRAGHFGFDGHGRRIVLASLRRLLPPRLGL